MECLKAIASILARVETNANGGLISDIVEVVSAIETVIVDFKSKAANVEPSAAPVSDATPDA